MSKDSTSLTNTRDLQCLSALQLMDRTSNTDQDDRLIISALAAEYVTFYQRCCIICVPIPVVPACILLRTEEWVTTCYLKDVQISFQFIYKKPVCGFDHFKALYKDLNKTIKEKCQSVWGCFNSIWNEGKLLKLYNNEVEHNKSQ